MVRQLVASARHARDGATCPSDLTSTAKEQGWLGEVAAIETTLTAADQKL
jgi:hypothetical protein